jgi:hypothetical protein
MHRVDFWVLGGIAIIGLFFAPSVLDVFRMSRESSCSSNLVEVSRASLLYADDNDRFLPPIYTYDPTTGNGEKLLAVLKDYLGHESKRCPGDNPEFRKFQSSQVEGSGALGYVHDSSLVMQYNPKQPELKLINLDQVANPEGVLFFRDPIREVLIHDAAPHLHSPHGDRFMSTSLDGNFRRLEFVGSQFREIRSKQQSQ